MPIQITSTLKMEADDKIQFMSISFIPENFTVPEKLETDTFRPRQLTINDVVKDYDAVMTSIDHLQ